MNTNMTGFGCFLKNLCIPVFWTKVASALEGLIYIEVIEQVQQYTSYNLSI